MLFEHTSVYKMEEILNSNRLVKKDKLFPICVEIICPWNRKYWEFGNFVFGQVLFRLKVNCQNKKKGSRQIKYYFTADNWQKTKWGNCFLDPLKYEAGKLVFEAAN